MISKHCRKFAGLTLAVSLASVPMLNLFQSTPSGAGTAPNLTAAQQAVARAEKIPTTIGVTTPLKTKPVPGKTIVFLGIANGSVAYDIQGMEAAAKAIGWNVKVIGYDQTNVATLISAFNEALLYHPVAVTLTGISESLWQSVIPEYRKAGVSILPNCDPTPLNSVIIANICGTSDFSTMGEILANWFILNSGGTGQAILPLTPDFPILNALGLSFQAYVSANCSTCSVQTVTATLDQAVTGAITQQLVTAIQSNPSINYAIVPFSAFVPGLPSALNAAGLTGKVKIALGGPLAQDLTNLRQGTVSAVVTLADSYQGWLDVDVTLRHMQGIKYSITDGGLPIQLLTPTSKFSLSAVNYTEPKDFPKLFKKLWKLG